MGSRLDRFRDGLLSLVDRASARFGEGVGRVRGGPRSGAAVEVPGYLAPGGGGNGNGHGRAASFNLDPTFAYSARLRSGTTVVQRPFHSHPWLFSIITGRADEIAQAPLRLHSLKADGALGDPLPVTDPLAKVLAHPNERLDGRGLVRMSDMYAALVGEAFWLLERNDADEIPTRIWPLPGGSLWHPGPLDETTGEPSSWVFRSRGREIPYEAHQVVQFKPIPDPDNPVRGLSPLTAAMMSVEADVLADRFTAEFFRTGASPGGVLQFPGPLTNEQIARIRGEWQDTHGGSWNAHRFGILYNGATWVPTQISQRDMEFIEMKRWSRAALAAAFRWPLWMLTDESTSYATASESRWRLWFDTLIPLLKGYESVVATQLVSGIREGVGCAFDLDQVAALSEYRATKWDTAGKMKAAGVSLKEINRVLDLRLQPQPGWDQVLVGLGQVPIEEAISPPEPIALPAEPKEPGPSFEPTEEPVEPAIEIEIGQPIERGQLTRMALEWNASEGEIASKAEETWARLAEHPRERVAFKERRKFWRRWWLQVAGPSEAKVRGVIRPYMRSLAEHQVKRFDKVAREKGRGLALGVHARELTAGDIEAILFNEAEWDAILKPAYRLTIEQTARMSAAFTEGELGSFGKTLDLASDKVREFLARRVDLVTRINDTTRAALAKTLRAGFADGDTVQELRARIEATSDAFADPARALRIARTESGTVANGIRFQFGEPGDRGIWSASGDEIVRPSHVEAEETSSKDPVPVGQPFSNGLIYPHDPGGPASEVANCRCGWMVVPGEAA